MEIIAKAIQSLKLGPGSTNHGLTVFPLSGSIAEKEKGIPDYTTLEEAIGSGAVRITEVGEGGSVPDLQLINNGEGRVLILDGEMLIGAKQNRVLNITILAPGKSRFTVPVSCVEAGRWNRVSPEFASSKQVMYAHGRAQKMEQVNRNIDELAMPMAEQSAVWHDIAQKSARMGVRSPTANMGEIFEQCQGSMADYEKNFSPAANQVGAVFAIGDRLTGLELFDHPATLAKYFDRLIRSNALDAMETRDRESAAPTVDAAREFLQDVGRTETRPFQGGLGEGENFRLDGPRISGAALVADDRIIHLSAFRKEQETAGNGGGTRRNIINLLRWRRNR